MPVEKEVLLEMYTKMLTIRRFEERMVEEQNDGSLPGGVHTYIGEEAVAVGICAHLRPDDYITSTHRGHGHIIAKGGDTRRMMAELFGRRTGYCKGKGGSMHIADFSLGILGANGIVGGGLPTAAGAGLAAQLRGSDQVCVCFFGDGAANQGTFHEAVNLSAIWELPVIWVCENNLYAVTTPALKVISVEDIADRAAGFGIPGMAVDGQDIMAVYEATEEAVKRAREGGGPTLMECKTYRFMGHMGGKEMLASYRTQEELDEWLKRDPITLFEEDLVRTGAMTKAYAAELDEKIKADMDKAVKFAEESPWPEPEEALDDVYA